MNLLEQYIVEIHEAKEVTQDWGSFILVDVTSDCYGNVRRGKTSFPSWEAFEEAKKLGYYWG